MVRSRLRRPTRLAVAVAALAAVTAIPAGAAMSIYVDPEDLADRATLAVRGTVVETASGLDPRSGRLATYVTVEVGDVLRGPRDLDRVTLREPGGRWGDLVHDVDAVPRYRVGEEVLAFLEPASDGALRTAGMFFGKFSVETDPDGGNPVAVRDLDGRGRIAGRAGPVLERFDPDALGAMVARGGPVPRIRSDRGSRARWPGTGWLARPAEIEHLRWDDVEAIGAGGPATLRIAGDGRDSDAVHLSDRDVETVLGRFVTLSTSSPTRWYETDAGGVLHLDVDPARDPLGDPAAAVAAIEAAMDAWTGVPESRVALSVGDPALDHLATHGVSPATTYPSGNVVLFGDPYDDISDPIGCSGTLAIGGYWRSGSTGPAIHGTTFHRALRAYVIFNNDFECFLGDPDDLAEVATHELGHGLGFGHSSVPDAIMRSYAYGAGRGPRLGDDDRDAAHCIYPHTLTLLDPVGGETLEAGGVHPVSWTSTPEAGVDDGEVDLEYSRDGGATWQPVEGGSRNDGTHAWSVPAAEGDAYRFRVVRPNRVQPTPAPWPAACSTSASPSDFTVQAPPAPAGEVPDGSGGEPVRVGPDGSGGLRLTWAPSCSPGASDFAVYRGTLDVLRAGGFDASPVTCGTAGLTEASVPMPPGDAFYLVAPRTADAEGTYGRDSSGIERPAAASACAPREEAATCP